MRASFFCTLSALLLQYPLSLASPINSRAVISANVGMAGKTVRGVNLGGWFVLENWMTPSLFLTSEYSSQNVGDEWNYMLKASSKAQARSNLKQHWATWITEDDFQQIAKAGLNTVRIPVPFWAFIPIENDEPYQTKAQRPYIAQALLWARKYNLDVLFDLHTAPGSQNGFDNSGHAGPIKFGANSTDAQRTINALIQIVNLYVNDNTYGGVVKGIEVLNEPKRGKNAIPAKTLAAFHRDAYEAVRNAVSLSALVVPTILLSDAFVDVQQSWESMFPEDLYGPGTYAVDSHHYQAWQPYAGQPYDTQIDYFCDYASHLAAQAGKRTVIVGEFSIGIDTGCTPYKSCAGRTMKQDIDEHNSKAANLFYRRFFEAQVDAYERSAGGWVFWNWKTETVSTWSYKDSLEQGWIPSNVSDMSQQVFVPSSSSSCASKTPSRKIDFATES